MQQTAYLPERLFPSLTLDWRRTPLPSLLPWMLAGFAGIFVLALALMWRIWSTDALRSIGMYFPLISVALVLRAWRAMGWEARGTWWGLLPLLYALVLGRSGGNAVQALVFAPGMAVPLLPLGLTVFAFGSGVLLLLGGTRVWRRCLFPLALLLLVNPVPTAFAAIDIPLQYASARVAQAFALAIGVHPDVNQLRLMFAPNFGMFIAPGCNGIRGAVTLGYLALIVGYLYRFSLRFRALLVVGAVALGYVFNLLRLCVLVLFYRLALAFPWLQAHGEGADYLIGGVLFLLAVALFAVLIRWKRRAGPAQIDAGAGAARAEGAPPAPMKKRAVLWKGTAVLLLALLSAVPNLRDLLRRARGGAGESPLAAALLPQELGNYHRRRAWQEEDTLGQALYRWAAYTDSAGNEIDVGLWLGPGVHYPIGCHLARGDRPAWQRMEKLAAANGGSATFDLDFYAEEGKPILEAATVCDAGGCNQSVVMPRSGNFVFAGMGLGDLFLRPTSSPLPVVVRVRSGGAASQEQMLARLRDFVAGMNTADLVRFAKEKP